MNEMRQGFLVVIRWVGENFAAFLPDIPGCVATGQTVEETFNNAKDSFEGFMAALPANERKQYFPQSEAWYIRTP